jgi:hypothetical protein
VFQHYNWPKHLAAFYNLRINTFPKNRIVVLIAALTIFTADLLEIVFSFTAKKPPQHRQDTWRERKMNKSVVSSYDSLQS